MLACGSQQANVIPSSPISSLKRDDLFFDQFVSALTVEGLSPYQKIDILKFYLGIAEGGGISLHSSIAVNLFHMLPFPCPRRRRAYEWWALLEGYFSDNPSINENLKFVRWNWCRHLGPNYFDVAATGDDIIHAFGECVDGENLGADAIRVASDFNTLSVDDQIAWEMVKWSWSNVPRPEFFLKCLLMCDVVSVTSDDLMEKNLDALNYFFNAFEIEGQEEKKYCRRQVTKTIAVKVASVNGMKRVRVNRSRQQYYSDNKHHPIDPEELSPNELAEWVAYQKKLKEIRRIEKAAYDRARYAGT